jgi:hypothetical protein
LRRGAPDDAGNGATSSAAATKGDDYANEEDAVGDASTADELLLTGQWLVTPNSNSAAADIEFESLAGPVRRCLERAL